MNLYFEVAYSVVDRFGGRYFAAYNVQKRSTVLAYSQLALYCDRIWQEDDTGVKYIKNRFSDIYDTHGHDVNMEEFMLVKLKSKTA